MSSMSKVAGLSRFITTLPTMKTSLPLIVILSAFIGILIILIEPLNISLPFKFLFGAITGFIIFGLSTIFSGLITSVVVSKLNGLNIKKKHGIFLSLSSLFIIIVLTLLFIIISFFTNDLIINSIYLSYTYNKLKSITDAYPHGSTGHSRRFDPAGPRWAGSWCIRNCCR